MKPIIYVIAFLPLISFGQTTAIPDPNFEQALINLGHDNVLDGNVLTANINNIYVLNLSGQNISDLSGIEAFVYLNYLFCDNNYISSLDLSNNINLREIECSNNSLECLTIYRSVSYQSLTAINNPMLYCIQLNNMSALNGPLNYYIDSIASFSTNCNNSCNSTNTSNNNLLGNNNTNVSIYPNPMTDIATFRIPENMGPYYIFIYDVLGNIVRIIEGENSKKQTIEKGILKNGVYLFEVEFLYEIGAPEGRYSGRFIVK